MIQEKIWVVVAQNGSEITESYVFDNLADAENFVEEIKPVHHAQLLTYMKMLEKPQGLLINFFTDNITRSMKPFVNEYFTSLPD